MDERVVTERFHEALDVEPRAGAYERFRAEFVTSPAAAKRRPVFRLRFSKMAFRLGAAVALAAIAIALVAGILATHRGPTGQVPASTNKNLVDYQNLVLRDYNAFANATSNHCNTIDDQGCAAAVRRLVPSMEGWINDLTAFPTPPQYVVLDARLRAHLTLAEAELNALAPAQQRHDAAGFTMAINAALYERAWIDPAAFTLEGTDQTDVASYSNAVRVAYLSLLSCENSTPGPDALACSHLAAAESCLGAAAQACADDIQSAETQLQNFIIAIAQNPAPSSLVVKDRQFEAALTKADDALLDLVKSQLAGDAARVSADELAYESAISLAATTSADLANP